MVPSSWCRICDNNIQERNTITIGDGGADVWKQVRSVGAGEQSTWIDDKDRTDEIQKEQQLMWQKLQTVARNKQPLAGVSAKKCGQYCLVDPVHVHKHNIALTVRTWQGNMPNSCIATVTDKSVDDVSGGSSEEEETAVLLAEDIHQ